MSRWGLIVLAALFAGCGFQLQGALQTPAAMERTYVATSNTHSQFYRKLCIALDDAGVEVVDAPADASAILTIAFDDTDQRVLSVSARNVPTEYEVYYTIAYALDSGEKRLLDEQSLTVTRNYTYDSTLVLGKAHEEAQLRDALVDDLVRIVLKQIALL